MISGFGDKFLQTPRVEGENRHPAPLLTVRLSKGPKGT